MIGCTLVPSAFAASSSQPIVIGTVNDVTGVQAAVFGDSNKTLQAWADWTNANGGIDGHPIKLIAFDDQFNPTTTLTDVKELVQQDHVVAIVGEQSSYESVFASYLQQKGIPLVGDGLYDNVGYGYSDSFPQGTTNPAEQYNVVQLGLKQGYKKMANLYCAEAPSCAGGVSVLQKAATHLGVDFAYKASIAATAPNYTAQCLGAKASGSQFVFIADAAAIALRVSTACAQQGFTAPQEFSGLAVQGNLATASENGMLAVQPDLPYFDTASPGIKTMDAELNKYEPGVVNSADFGMSEVLAWASGLLFTQAAKAAHVGANATPAQIINGLYSLHGTTLDGLSPPLTYTKGGGHHVDCNFVMGVKNAKFVLTQGTKLLCAPAAFS